MLSLARVVSLFLLATSAQAAVKILEVPRSEKPRELRKYSPEERKQRFLKDYRRTLRSCAYQNQRDLAPQVQELKVFESEATVRALTCTGARAQRLFRLAGAYQREDHVIQNLTPVTVRYFGKHVKTKSKQNIQLSSQCLRFEEADRESYQCIILVDQQQKLFKPTLTPNPKD